MAVRKNVAATAVVAVVVEQNWFSIVKNVSTMRHKNTTITFIESTLKTTP